MGEEPPEVGHAVGDVPVIGEADERAQSLVVARPRAAEVPLVAVEGGQEHEGVGGAALVARLAKRGQGILVSGPRFVVPAAGAIEVADVLQEERHRQRVVEAPPPAQALVIAGGRLLESPEAQLGDGEVVEGVADAPVVAALAREGEALLEGGARCLVIALGIREHARREVSLRHQARIAAGADGQNARESPPPLPP
jgi:hypothetical protein